MKRLTICVLFLLLCSSLSFAKGGGHGRTSSSSKTVSVSGYTTKSGKHVKAYRRSAPGTASSAPAVSFTPYKQNHMADGYTAHDTVRRDKHGKIKRSTPAKNEFKREHPCPVNGHASGSCPGYVIDHVKPLECGGADAPTNMQWQTVAEGKAKDKTERYCR